MLDVAIGLFRWEYHAHNFLGFVQLACLGLKVRYLSSSTDRYDANSSSSTFASFRSRVSKPSVNQP
jgi:hypothetical protein